MLRALVLGAFLATASGGLLASDPLDRPWLPIEQGAARFRLSFGRLHVDRLTSFSGQKQAIEYADGSKESYVVAPVGGGVRAEYERTRPDLDRVAFRFEADGSFRLTKETHGGERTTRLELLQPAEGWMTLTVAEGDASVRTLRAPTLWHMYLRDPDFCRAHVVPALRELRVAVDLERVGDELTTLVLRRADESPAPSREATLGWIHDLSDPSFKVRRTADDSLRALGPSLVAWVRHFPVDRLDREQRDRLREMVSTLEASADDRADRLAVWLAEDPWVWGEILAKRPDAKLVAVERIESLTGETVAAAVHEAEGYEADVARTRELCQQERRSLR